MPHQIQSEFHFVCFAQLHQCKYCLIRCTMRVFVLSFSKKLRKQKKLNGHLVLILICRLFFEYLQHTNRKVLLQSSHFCFFIFAWIEELFLRKEIYFSRTKRQRVIKSHGYFELVASRRRQTFGAISKEHHHSVHTHSRLLLHSPRFLEHALRGFVLPAFPHPFCFL